ncbi:hypothetical protein LCGC14_2092440, partial [marine sediment metagenome]
MQKIDLNWKIVIAIAAIAVTIGSSTIAITADGFKELRRADREQQEMIP